jgi:simple sugar transport system permease protein
MLAFLGSFGDILANGPLYQSTFRLAAILVFAAVGEWVAERAGTINLSVEAMLLGGHFASAIAFSRSDCWCLCVIAAGISESLLER